jgi:outer membrane protein assembly factor BamB
MHKAPESPAAGRTTGCGRVVSGWLVVILLLAAAPRRCPADWPQFRGPDGDGHSRTTGLPLRWSDTEGVAWKASIPGLGWASPVVHAGRIYLTTAVPQDDGQSLRLVCVDAGAGTVLWNTEIFGQDAAIAIHQKNSHASPTPVVADDAIFVHFGPHGTARTGLDGTVAWRTTLPYKPVHGNGGSPALAGDVLVISCDGGDAQYVAGLDAKTGAIRWKTPRDTRPSRGFSFATPLVCTVGDRTLAVCPGSDAVFAYDPRTGTEIWRADYPGGYSVIPRPVFAAGLVFVGSGYDKPALIAIDPTGDGNVTDTHVRWRLDRAAPHTPSPIVVGDELYCVSDNGIATCVDARTGTEHWRERLGGGFSASPLAADGRIYFQNESGEAIVVAAGKTFTELARNRLAEGERTFASYAVDGPALLIRTESNLYRIGK